VPDSHTLEKRGRVALRAALSFYVLNGLSAALGLLVITSLAHLFLGAFAASAASIGVIVCIPPDQPAPKRGKFRQLLPAALIGLPLFLGVQVLHADPLRLGLLLVPASFFAFLAAAWGKRGIPLSVSIMFAMIFSMAVPDHVNTATNLATGLFFALGAGLYLVWATLANALLNARYRGQMLADTLQSLANLMRTQALQFAPATSEQGGQGGPLIGHLIKQQAALADQLQTARDILLEAPRTPRRQQLAGMLMGVLDMRDHLLACELDLDTLKSHPGHLPVLATLREVLDELAVRVERLADALLLGRTPASFELLRPRLAGLHWTDEGSLIAGANSPSPAMLARGLASRVGHIDEEVLRLLALARGEAEPDLDLVRATWQMFVSPTAWSWRPFAGLWRWDAPPLRHAIRAALAIGTAYAIALALPWGTHDYWILLTIVVVLRGSLAQTLERRNSRVAGTLMGCLLAAALLSVNAPAAVLLVAVTLAQALAHAFAVRRYLVTAVAATVLGLVQSHLLNAGTSPTFDVVERLADTLIGVAIAWAFSYVLPSWERHQIPALVARTLAAQARHARVALGLGQLQAVDNEPELAWRLARREAYDSLSALVQATQRSLSEPRAVRPPLEPLSRLLAHSYQLLAQLTVIKTMLLLRRERLKPAQIRTPLMRAAETIEVTLTVGLSEAAGGHHPRGSQEGPVALPDPFENDLNPWVLRRLDLAAGLALQLREDADQVLRAPVD
jgi:uncharacterized membrane protein YccC